MTLNFNYSSDHWRVPPSSEHPFMTNIREAVMKYRIRSASYFNIPIKSSQAIHAQNPSPNTSLHAEFTLYVGFYNFGSPPIFAACRPRTLPNGKNGLDLYPNHIEVLLQDSFVPLRRFLNTTFPRYKMSVGDTVMYEWWTANGKTFAWTRLPTELKERIVQFCMHRSALPLISKRNMQKPRGAREVMAHFGQWAALLRVSHQVRAICLRLCFMGSSDLAFGKGLCISFDSINALKQCMRRLGKYSQLQEPRNGSITTDDKTAALARTYSRYPKIYPHLQRYATLSHGIRKLSLRLSFIEALHFFKVTAAGFAQYWRLAHYLDYNIFERLPRLNELRVYLPDASQELEDKVRQYGPRIFHDEPCPRILHRLIYERAAEVLAEYPFVTLHDFMDEVEELRYNTLRNEAIDSLKFNEKELEELYMEEGGGVELEDSVDPGIGKGDVEEVQQPIIHNDFWPPECKCEVPCRQVFR